MIVKLVDMDIDIYGNTIILGNITEGTPPVKNFITKIDFNGNHFNPYIMNYTQTIGGTIIGLNTKKILVPRIKYYGFYFLYTDKYYAKEGSLKIMCVK